MSEPPPVPPLSPEPAETAPGEAIAPPDGSLAARARKNPDAIDLIVLLRAIERGAGALPRIGKSRTIREDCVTLGQEPYVEFPLGNLASIEDHAGRPHVMTRFLGFFGPQGALPLSTTLEAIAWRDAQDPSFLRFSEIVSNRFLQLFFRAFADARAITQNDRPTEDRFGFYLASLSGGAAEDGRASPMSKAARLGFAGLLSKRAKTPAQLSQLLSGALGIRATIVERVPSWLIFEPDEQTALGVGRSSLGRDTAIGTRQLSLADKIAIEIRATNLAEYRALLPGGRLAGALAELVFLALGRRVEAEVRLGIPAGLTPPMCLGKSGELGLTGWVGPPPDPAAGTRDDAPYRFDARYVPALKATACSIGPKIGIDFRKARCGDSMV
ncbi:type VI secretion system baseplate subunit TssG [Jiella mangrovi]|uniref:Type VI secretion system baseplate subunit TssG n=1 Tax=Jiella mangrovi TaxID=2821407 RepID=A0ABS4BGQ2_9HYPH|nr:type VI secretion system baseplate subunit TssG [Jiella mangrovi]MBP0615933.1 type VI secretion system baseplate subunit TssG [Jiella mangrovi]